MSDMHQATTADNNALIIQMMAKLDKQEDAFERSIKESTTAWQAEIKLIYGRLDVMATTFSSARQISWTLVLSVIAIIFTGSAIITGGVHAFVSGKLAEITPIISNLGDKVSENSAQNIADIAVLTQHRITAAERDAASEKEREWMKWWMEKVMDGSIIANTKP